MKCRRGRRPPAPPSPLSPLVGNIFEYVRGVEETRSLINNVLLFFLIGRPLLQPSGRIGGTKKRVQWVAQEGLGDTSSPPKYSLIRYLYSPDGWFQHNMLANCWVTVTPLQIDQV